MDPSVSQPSYGDKSLSKTVIIKWYKVSVTSCLMTGQRLCENIGKM